jgi:hypothetical protein
VNVKEFLILSDLLCDFKEFLKSDNDGKLPYEYYVTIEVLFTVAESLSFIRHKAEAQINVIPRDLYKYISQPAISELFKEYAASGGMDLIPELRQLSNTPQDYFSKILNLFRVFLFNSGSQ